MIDSAVEMVAFINLKCLWTNSGDCFEVSPIVLTITSCGLTKPLQLKREKGKEGIAVCSRVCKFEMRIHKTTLDFDGWLLCTRLCH